MGNKGNKGDVGDVGSLGVMGGVGVMGRSDSYMGGVEEIGGVGRMRDMGYPSEKGRLVTRIFDCELCSQKCYV